MADVIPAKDSGLAKQLFAAIEAKDAEAIETLAAQGAEMNGALDGVPPLVRAAEIGDGDVIRALIEHGAAVDGADASGRTPLYVAVDREQGASASVLVQKDADPDLPGPDGMSPRALAQARDAQGVILMMEVGREEGSLERICAAINGDDMDALRKELARKLLTDFNRVSGSNPPPVMLAIREDSPAALELLLEAGASAQMAAKGLDRDTPLSYVLAHYRQNPRLADILLKHGADPNADLPLREQPLLRAAGDGMEVIVRLLLDAGAKTSAVNSSQENAAHLAAKGGHAELIPLLKTAGVDLDAVNSVGETPLMSAIGKRHRAAFDALLEAGADPAKTGDRGFTALMQAAWAGEQDVIPALLRRGLDANAKDANGFTALHHAAYRGKTAAVRALLDGGAEPEPAAEDGRMPRDIAAERGCAEVVALITARTGLDKSMNEGLAAPKTFSKPLRIVLPGARNG